MKWKTQIFDDVIFQEEDEQFLELFEQQWQNHHSIIYIVVAFLGEKKKPGFGVVQVVINKVLMYWFVVKVIGNCKASRWYFEWDFTGLFRTDVWGLYSSLNSRNSSNSLQQQQKTRDFACRQVHLPLQSTAESVNLQESERKSSRLGWTRLSLKPKEYQETEGNMHFGQGCGSEAERLPSMQ